LKPAYDQSLPLKDRYYVKNFTTGLKPMATKP